jgi:hypothetical protein
MIPLLGISIWSIAKIFILIILALYMVFAGVIIKQIQQMNKTLQVGFEFPIKMAAFLHLLFAVFIFIFSLSVL